MPHSISPCITPICGVDLTGTVNSSEELRTSTFSHQFKTAEFEATSLELWDPLT